ncbi:DAK2 domain-containing protein [Microbacterium karelineae]|uniref:DAK2 domain-containing protein n=1 Tax=Microbacterium karelineae TaxID=2654283 RepID=UPI0018D28F6D
MASEIAQATAVLTSRFGRARVLSQRSMGHFEPGAVLSALAARAAAEVAVGA